MIAKKPYTSPQIFQVELNQQQAILAQCHTSATSLSGAGARGCQLSQNCRRSTSNNGNSAGAPS